MRAPAARASGLNDLEIIVDSGERYPYRFASQQATTVRAQLACGDYGLRRDGQLVAVVERKSLENLARSLVDGQMAGQLAELATAPRAAVVVEERYSRLFTLGHVARAAPGAAAADASRSPGLGRGERVRGLAEGRVPQVVL